MKKLIAILIATAMACAFAPMVGADASDHIDVTLTPGGTASITVDQATWTPVCSLGGSNTTSSTWATITNDGDVDVLVNVTGDDTEDWTLAGSADIDQFVMATTGIAVGLTTSPQLFIADLPAVTSNTAQFGLSVTMPTASSTNAVQHTTVTFEATAL